MSILAASMLTASGNPNDAGYQLGAGIGNATAAYQELKSGKEKSALEAAKAKADTMMTNEAIRQRREEASMVNNREITKINDERAYRTDYLRVLAAKAISSGARPMDVAKITKALTDLNTIIDSGSLPEGSEDLNMALERRSQLLAMLQGASTVSDEVIQSVPDGGDDM
jgi:hypothetical protein